MRCDFCFRQCDIPPNGLGFCNVRKSDGTSIVDVAYGTLVALAVDPVEKKPLYHFLPGTQTVSLAMAGCNLTCSFCQNWSISQAKGGIARDAVLPTEPSQIVDYAVQNSYPSVSYTYSEPLVWQDYMLAVAQEAYSAGLYNIMVSNGTFSPAACSRIIPKIDAFNIDVKGDDAFYRNVCGGRLAPVLDGIAAIVQGGKHLEVTTMVIEGVHSLQMVKELGTQLHNLGVQVWHLSRFFPQYRMQDRKMTSEAYLAAVVEVAKSCGIAYVYPGNSRLEAPTRCPSCGLEICSCVPLKVADGRCPHCHEQLYGIWDA